MKQYKIWNNTLGWLTFIIAALTYCLTVEPTASFWDCPEFILSGNKLEVGHPPGAPFFMLTANFFSMFASPENVAYWVNIMSALLSAGGILFLFWSITHLTRKLIVGNSKEITASQMITIFGSGLVGALAYTWSDTYWFSAVEGEVYGYSSLFTAVVFWLILKWEDNADSPHSDRWLILIAYLVGLSIGVHLLNLLCIPAIVLVVYYKKFPNANFWGSMLALVVSAVIVMAVLYGVVPGVVKVGGWFELLFVNVLGCPFNTGLYVYIVLLFATIIGGIILTEKSKNQFIIACVFTFAIALLGIPFYGNDITISVLLGILILSIIFWVCCVQGKITYSKTTITVKYLVSRRLLNTTFLSLLLIMIGYSSYTLIVVRSSANTPMDQNSPEDIFTLGSYLNREQYGTRPLLYGQFFDSEVKRNDDGTAVYEETTPVYTRVEKKNPNDPDRYEIVEYNKEYEYAQNMWFPRMYSSDHAGEYERWIGHTIKNTEPAEYSNKNIKVPSQWDNICFFTNYQMNHMYWRYFLWNFVGRQNDIQNNYGEKEYGNWITGIPVIDDWRLGDQDKLPTSLKENKGHNVYFALPLILGIIGIMWQLANGRKGKQQFSVVLLLFFMTGLAIVLYLNQTPLQPRERDYAYAGSFYAFAIWIGMGVAGIIQPICDLFSKENNKGKTISSIITTLLCLIVPLQMLSQNWDDHDRSGRYACRDFGQNYLETLPEGSKPIIFTCGDNDTFPLWYNQEVEGESTEARVCNLSYLQTDWYIDQMKRPAYDSPSLPITWERINYVGNTNMVIYVVPMEDFVMQYRDVYPERFLKAFGEGNPFEMNKVTKHWILESDITKGSKISLLTMDFLQNLLDIRTDYESSKYKAAKRKLDKKLESRCYARLVVDDIITLYEKVINDQGHRIKNRIEIPRNIVPSEKLYIPIDAEAVRRSGMMIPDKYKYNMPEYMTIDISDKGALYRHELVMFDMLANANWERPIYMSMTVGEGNYPATLTKFFVHEGLAYRITPFDWSQLGYDTRQGDRPVDIDKFYTNVMERFKWGGVKEHKDYYADETIRRMIYTHRNLISQLATEMIHDDKQADERIIALLEKLHEEFPHEIVPYDALRDNTMTIASCYSIIYQIQNEYKKEIEYLKSNIRKEKEELEEFTNKQNGNITPLKELEIKELELELDSISTYYLGDSTLNLLKNRAQEISRIVLQNECEHLNWYTTLKLDEQNDIFIYHRLSLAIEAWNILKKTQGTNERIRENIVTRTTELLAAEIKSLKHAQDKNEVGIKRELIRIINNLLKELE